MAATLWRSGAAGALRAISRERHVVGRLRRRTVRLVSVAGVLGLVGLAAAPAIHSAPPGDSVKGSGTWDLICDGVAIKFSVDAQSGPNGESPSGTWVLTQPPCGGHPGGTYRYEVRCLVTGPITVQRKPGFLAVAGVALIEGPTSAPWGFSSEGQVTFIDIGNNDRMETTAGSASSCDGTHQTTPVAKGGVKIIDR